MQLYYLFAAVFLMVQKTTLELFDDVTLSALTYS